MFDRPAPPRPEAVPYGRYEDVLSTLKQALRGTPYLLGERFSAADVYGGAEIHWARTIGAPGFKDEPIFERYVAGLARRPAYQRSIAQDAKAFG